MKKPKRFSAAKVLALTLLGTAPLSALACNDESYLGTVCTFAFNYCPRGTLPADGRQLPVSQYTALFALLSNTYGGDGRTTFNLPDLRGRAAIGTGTSDYGTATTLGTKGGAATASLTMNNLPAHVHPASAQLAAGSVSNGTLTLPVSGGTVSGQTITGSVTVNALNGATAPTGGVSIPTSTANTVGKVASGLGAFYPQGSTPVAVPSTHNLAVSGGAISGATASANVVLPASPVPMQVVVGANTTAQLPVATMSPNIGLTSCIVVNGLYPSRP